jgi:hypothetical protein
MADNVTILPASGVGTVLVATDDINGVHHQLVKLEYGPLDQATLVTTSSPLPVGGLVVVGTDASGNLQFDYPRRAAVFKSFDFVAGTGTVNVWTPASGKRFRLLQAVVTTDVACTLSFQDQGTTFAVARTAAGQPLVLSFGNGYLSTAVNRLLQIQRGTSATLTGTVMGVEE